MKDQQMASITLGMVKRVQMQGDEAYTYVNVCEWLKRLAADPPSEAEVVAAEARKQAQDKMGDLIKNRDTTEPAA